MLTNINIKKTDLGGYPFTKSVFLIFFIIISGVSCQYTEAKLFLHVQDLRASLQPNHQEDKTIPF